MYLLTEAETKIITIFFATKFRLIYFVRIFRNLRLMHEGSPGSKTNSEDTVSEPEGSSVKSNNHSVHLGPPVPSRLLSSAEMLEWLHSCWANQRWTEREQGAGDPLCGRVWKQSSDPKNDRIRKD